MSEEQINPVTQNQLIRIGVLLTDLRRDLDFDIDESQLEFLEYEFERIVTQITAMWADRPIGLSYALEFHGAEAMRLMSKITEADLQETTADDDLRKFRIQVNTVIKTGLGTVVKTINNLIEGEGIKIGL